MHVCKFGAGICGAGICGAGICGAGMARVHQCGDVVSCNCTPNLLHGTLTPSFRLFCEQRFHLFVCYL